MRVPVSSPATYADIEALPDDVVGELIGGELFVSPRPASRSARVTSVLGTKIGGPFDHGAGARGTWWILDEPELAFGKDVLVPDLAGWRRSRMPRVPVAAQFTLAPDWACEVLSPKTARVDLEKKLPVYAREGVGHAWIIDPVLRTLQVFERRGGDWLLASAFAGDDAANAAPFAEVPLELGALWLPTPTE